MTDANPSPAGKSETRRFPEVDVLKAAGILGVVLIHSLRAHFHPQLSSQEAWLLELLRFAVPGFLSVSGFLYATREPVPFAQTLRRLRRILIPYLLASVAAEIFWHELGGEPQTGSVVKDLLVGAAFGPYYYVFLIVVLVILSPSLPLLPRRALPVLFALSFAAQGLLENGIGNPPDLLWAVRNPLRWAAYFLAGWWVRLHYAEVAAQVVRQRSRWALAFGVPAAGLAALLASELWPAARRSASWLEIWAIVCLLFVLCCGRAPASAPVRALSDATYAIYLFHLFFVVRVQYAFPAPPGSIALVPILLPWLAGMGGSLAIIGLGRVLLGRRSRDWIGA